MNQSEGNGSGARELVPGVLGRGNAAGNDSMSIFTTLEEWNETQTSMWRKFSSDAPRPNRIACPNCNAELVDPTPNIQISGNPPRLNVECPKCGFKGTRVA